MAVLDYENYEYDVDESHRTFYWEQLGPVLVVYGITFFLGLSGNCLIVFTIYKHSRMQTVTNILLASLATADLLLIVFCVPIKVAKLFSYTWAYGLFLCKFVHYIQYVSIICSVLTLTAISVERYYAIVHPMRAKYICTTSQARRVIMMTWILAVILATPILLAQVLLPVGVKIKAFWCVRDSNNTALWRYHEIYMLILILIIPFTIMTLAYSLICWEVWNIMERRSLMTSRHALSRDRTTHIKDTEVIYMQGIQKTRGAKRSKNERDDSKMVKQVICMLITVVLLFAICWGPVLLDNVLTAYNVLPPERIGPFKHMGTIFHLMSYLNSCINPVIYGFMSKNFKESFRSVLCCTNNGQRNGGRTTSSIRQISRTSSQTRNTSVR